VVVQIGRRLRAVVLRETARVFPDVCSKAAALEGVSVSFAAPSQSGIADYQVTAATV
jgi:hypothetical protein